MLQIIIVGGGVVAIETFRRREHKYLITTEQYVQLVQLISSYLRPDRHGINGKYTVTTLYFESLDHKIYIETKNKLQFRQKLRLRVYDKTNISGNAFFEIKQKYEKAVNKRRVVIPLGEAYRYLANESSLALSETNISNQHVFYEIDDFRKLYALQPEMVVSYERHAFHHIEDADLRVTFDLNLRCRNDDLYVEHGPHGEHFIDSNLVILEIKTSKTVPHWLTQALQDLHCEKRSVSKFCASLELLKSNKLPSGVTKENTAIDF